MENDYYKLLNFVTRLSQPKKTDAALKTMSDIDQEKGNDALDIFENGIDNAQAIIAIEARKLLSQLASNGPELPTGIRAFPRVNLVFGMTNKPKKVEKVVVEEKDIENSNIKYVEKAHIEHWLTKCNNNKTLTAKKLGISLKGLYNKIKEYELNY